MIYIKYEQRNKKKLHYKLWPKKVNSNNSVEFYVIINDCVIEHNKGENVLYLEKKM